VTSVAYPAEPSQPGWTSAIGALLAGWIIAGFATLGLYLAATFAGAIGHPSSHALDSLRPVRERALNDWPYPSNGLWSLLANIAVVLLVLVLTTKATSWWLRGSYQHFSDLRLALVLVFTGWLPLNLGGPVGGLFGFLVAVLLIRGWVPKRQDQLSKLAATGTVAGLAAFILVYGLLHPLWTVDVEGSSARGAHTALIVIHNVARVPVEVEGYTIDPPLPQPSQGFSLSPGRLGHLQHAFLFPARTDRSLTQTLPQGCGTIPLAIHVRYHVFGLPLSQTVPASARIGRDC
jgi:hypothetical protein